MKIINRLMANAAEYPERVALFDDYRHFTYKQLNELSADIASYIKSYYSEINLFGLTEESCLEQIVFILGILRAGAAFVVIKEEQNEVYQLLADRNVKIVFGYTKHNYESMAFKDVLSEIRNSNHQSSDEQYSSESLAYITYTSGSSGTPKAVKIPHRAIERLFIDQSWISLGKETISINNTSIVYDPSLIEILGPLMAGGKVYIPSYKHGMITAHIDKIREHNINFMQCYTELFHTLVTTNKEVFRNIKTLVVGGDVLSIQKVKSLLKAVPELTIYNAYGPAECGILSTVFKIDSKNISSIGTQIPIGRVVENTQIYLLDDDNKPSTKSGEIAIAGMGLSLGYINLPEYELLKSINILNQSVTVYLTGDMAELNENGELKFLGRNDRLVKISGETVDLNQINHLISGLPNFANDFRVIFERDKRKIHVFILITDKLNAPQSRMVLDNEILQRYNFLRSHIFYHFVTELPVSNLKIDDRALLETTKDTELDFPCYTKEFSPIQLLNLVQLILNNTDVNVNASYYELGLDSLLGLQLLDQLKKLGVELTLEELFSSKNVMNTTKLIIEKTGLTKSSKYIDESEWDTSVVLHPGPKEPKGKIFIFGGLSGDLLEMMPLSKHLGKQYSVIGLQTRGIAGHSTFNSVSEMSKDHIKYLLKHQTEGSYNIVGYSSGGYVAHAVADILFDLNKTVGFLGIIDVPTPGFYGSLDYIRKLIAKKLWYEKHGYRKEFLKDIKYRIKSDENVAKLKQIDFQERLKIVYDNYTPSISNIPIVFYKCIPRDYIENYFIGRKSKFGWDCYTTKNVTVKSVDFKHMDISNDDSARKLAYLIYKHVDKPNI